MPTQSLYERVTQSVKKIDLFLLASLAVAIIAALPLITHLGFLNTRGGGDSPFLIQRVHQMTVALRGGHFPVRWMPDANYGYGYPFFNYYAPLSIYIASLFRLLGWTTVGAIKLTQVLGFLVAAGGTYHLATSWFGNRWSGVLASAAYTLAPFHMVNVYVRGDSLAEFWAMALYPWVLWAADKAVETQDFASLRIVPLAVLYAGLVLSHNISALIFTPFLGIYILWRIFSETRQAQTRQAVSLRVGGALLAGVWGLGLSAWFWLPALGEQNLVQLGEVTEGYFSFRVHFWTITELVQSSLRFDYDVAERGAFRMGLVQAGVIVVGAIALFWAKTERKGVLWLGLGLATLMILPQSVLLWERLPLLEFTQFPWRFLSVQALFGALVIGSIGAWGRVRWIAPVLITIMIWSGLGWLKPDFVWVSEEMITAETLAQYEWATGNIGTTISAEYLPHTVQPRMWTSAWVNGGLGKDEWLREFLVEADRNAVRVLSGEAVAVRLDDGHPTRQQWQVNATTESVLVFPTMYFAGWETSLGAIAPAVGNGLIQITMPAGEHEVNLRFQHTPIRRGAEVISLAALILLVGVAWGRVLSVVLWGGLVLGFVWVLGVLEPSQRFEPVWDDNVTWDFDQRGFPHVAPAGVHFSDGGILATYKQAAFTGPGGWHSVSLEWARRPEQSGHDVRARLVSAGVNRYKSAAVISEGVLSRGGFYDYFSFEIPDNAPSGLYVVEIEVVGAEAVTKAGEGRGRLFLEPIPVVVMADVGESVVEVDDEGLLVKAVWELPEGETRNLQVTYRVYDSRFLFYGELDRQGGHGYTPTSLWGGKPMVDWVRLGWVADDGVAPFVVVGSWRDFATGEEVVRRQLGQLVEGENGLEFMPPAVGFELPENMRGVNASFGDTLSLVGYRLDSGLIELVWRAEGEIGRNLTHFVHVVDEAGDVVRQHDAQPREGTYPTGQWVAGQVVVDPAVLDLGGLEAGVYSVRVGVYEKVGEQFMNVGEPIILDETIEIGE